MENKMTIKKILKDVWVMKKSIYIYNFLLTTFNILKILLATYILKYIFDVIVIDNNYRKSLIVILAYGIIVLLIEVINILSIINLKYLILISRIKLILNIAQKLKIFHLSILKIVILKMFQTELFQQLLINIFRLLVYFLLYMEIYC